MPTVAGLPAGKASLPASDAERVVTLSGQIDLARRTHLRRLSRRLSRYDGPMVVDLAELTFGDASLAGFLAELLGRESARIEAPTRLSQEFLKLYGLDQGVRSNDRGRSRRGSVSTQPSPSRD